MQSLFKRSLFFSTVFLGLMVFLRKIVLAEETCTVNGNVVPCEQLGKQITGFLGWGILTIFIVLALGIFCFVFWLLMIIHAAQHDIDNKAMWIIIMVFTGIIGAVIYYFVVKRKFDKKFIPPSPSK